MKEEKLKKINVLLGQVEEFMGKDDPRVKQIRKVISDIEELEKIIEDTDCECDGCKEETPKLHILLQADEVSKNDNGICIQCTVEVSGVGKDIMAAVRKLLIEVFKDTPLDPDELTHYFAEVIENIIEGRN